MKQTKVLLGIAAAALLSFGLVFADCDYKNNTTSVTSTGDNNNNTAPETSTGDNSNNTAPETSTGDNSNNTAPETSTGDNSNNTAPETSTGDNSNNTTPETSTDDNSNNTTPVTSTIWYGTASSYGTLVLVLFNDNTFEMIYTNVHSGVVFGYKGTYTYSGNTFTAICTSTKAGNDANWVNNDQYRISPFYGTQSNNVLILNREGVRWLNGSVLMKE